LRYRWGACLRCQAPVLKPRARFSLRPWQPERTMDRVWPASLPPFPSATGCAPLRPAPSACSSRPPCCAVSSKQETSPPHACWFRTLLRPAWRRSSSSRRAARGRGACGRWWRVSRRRPCQCTRRCGSGWARLVARPGRRIGSTQAAMLGRQVVFFGREKRRRLGLGRLADPAGLRATATYLPSRPSSPRVGFCRKQPRRPRQRHPPTLRGWDLWRR